MILEDKINAFAQIGEFLQQFTQVPFQKNDKLSINNQFFDSFSELIHQMDQSNGWFTIDQVVFANESWSEALTKENLNQWLSAYTFKEEALKNVGLILAGNIPYVGFHDVLSVLLSGNKALIKLSSNDQFLIPFILKILVAIEPRFESRIAFTKERLENFDAVIATGSNNTARYFEYYFGKYPNIIRKNRNSAAVLTGNETHEELVALGEDIFRYYGLGCRNVSKLFVPKNYDFTAFFKAMYTYKDVIYYEKYANNYDYNKAVFLMSNFNILDNDFLTIKEDTSFASPISSVFYEYYNDIDEVAQRLEIDKEKIQCVVSHTKVQNSIPFGTTQKPKLWEYADNVDTMKFLLSL
ncbi:MAG TPA: acyl-CoA reductase [Flavobacterium sp.]|nr:acyl-CoA reductase [Flavobacterium sp.]